MYYMYMYFSFAEKPVCVCLGYFPCGLLVHKVKLVNCF